MSRSKKICIRITAVILNIIMLSGTLNLPAFAKEVSDDTADIEKTIKQRVTEMLQNSQIIYSDEDSTFELVKSNIEISDDYTSESSYISEVDASTYERLQEKNEEPVLYSNSNDPYPGDDLVYLTQRWLNQEYGHISGFGSVPENGRTGWDTVYGLLRALQYELGITSLANSFGSTTSSLYSQNLLKRNDGVTDRKYAILQGALWCKGYDPGHTIHDKNGVIYFDEVFDESVEKAIIQLKKDAGLSNPDGIVTLNVMKALMSMDSFKLLPSYYGSDSSVRVFQQKLNRKYEEHIGWLVPCDGVYGRNTNKALVYALQAEEGLPANIANGNFGATTILCCPEIPYVANSSAARSYPGNATSSYYTSNQIMAMTELVQFALYVNGFGNGTFNGNFDANTQKNLINFQKHHAISATGIADRNTWLSLFISKGNPDRSALGADCATILNKAKAKTLYDNGYRYIGRYLTGTAGGVSKALTREEAEIILDTGMRFFPIYQTRGNRLDYFTADKGSADAEAAIAAATALGIPKNTIIYFAVDYDVLDGNIPTHIIPYFEKVNEVMSESTYRVGIYGTRNVCSRISAIGYACSSFVSDMSTGFSGNLGFRLPDNWAFDQFANLEGSKALGSGDGRIEIDKDAVSGRDQGVSKLDKVSNIPISESDLNIGSTDSAMLKGPMVEIFGHETPLFEFYINFDTPIADLKIDIDNKNDTAKVLMGVDLSETSTEVARKQKFGQTYGDVKKLVDSIGKSPQEFEYNFRKTESKMLFKRTKTVFDMDTSVLLYIEMDLNSGDIIEGGGALIGSASVSHLIYTHIPCVYFKLQIEGSLKAGFKIVLNKETQKYDMNGEVNFSVEPSVALVADILLANASVGAKGELACKLKIPFESFQDGFKANLTLSLFLEYNALLWGGSYEKNFVDVTLYPPEDSEIQSLSISEDDLQFIEPISQTATMFANSDPNIFKSNMQVYCQPQIVALSNGNLFMTYIDDSQNRTAQNRTILMYSIFDGNSWSTPLPVWDDGTVDFAPVLYPDGNNGVHILWQNGTVLFNESVTQKDMESKMDLQYTHWNGSAFEHSTAITSSNQNFETQHKIVASGNNISVLWTQNSENDSLLLTGTNSIFRKQFNGSSWQETETLASELSFINSLDTSYNGEKNVFAYTTKTNNTTSTTSDLEVFYNNGTSTLKITDDDSPDYSVKLFGNEIYWISDSSIVYTTSNSLSSKEVIIDEIGSGASNFKVINNASGNKTVVWSQQNNDSGVNFYGANYNSNTHAFDTPEPLTMNNGVIRGWDACMLQNGQIELAYGFAEKLAEPSDGKFYGAISLIKETVNQYSNIYVDPSVIYDGNINAGETITLYSNIYNNGSLPVSQVNVDIFDQNNDLIQTSNITDINLGAGESTEISIPFTLPNSITRSDYIVKITASDEAASLMFDNEAILSIGFADLAITSVTEKRVDNTRHLEVVVENQGYSLVDTALLKLVDISGGRKVIDAKGVINLSPGDSETYTFVLSEKKLDPSVSDSPRRYSVTIQTFETSYQEYDSSNNTQEITVYPDYLISLLSGIGGTVSGSTTAVKDSIVTVVATPRKGYIFDGWYEKNKLLYGISSTYSFTAMSNRTLMAKFKPNDLAITDIEILGRCIEDERLTFAASSTGGSSTVNWYFEIKDEAGNICYSHADSLNSFFEWTPTSSQKYVITAYCTDDSGYQVSYSKEFKVAAIIDSGECGADATWSVDNYGVLRISGTGIMNNYSIKDEDNRMQPWWDYHDQVNTIIIEEGITRIGDRAFEGGWPLLSDVTISNTVTYIGVYAFYSAMNLEHLVIPDSVEHIGYSAFRDAGVKKLHIGTGVNSIGDMAFRDCPLMNLYIPENVVWIGSDAFYCADNILSQYTHRDLRSVTILNPDANIGSNAFGDIGNVLTIYGYANSTAQNYASVNGHEFYQITADESFDSTIKSNWHMYLEKKLSTNPALKTYAERTLIYSDNGQELSPSDRFYVYKIHTTLGFSSEVTRGGLERNLELSYYDVMGESADITILSGYEEAYEKYKLEGNGGTVTNKYRIRIQLVTGVYETDVEIVMHKDVTVYG